MFACVPELKKGKNSINSKAYKHLHEVSHLPVSGLWSLITKGMVEYASDPLSTSAPALLSLEYPWTNRSKRR